MAFTGQLEKGIKVVVKNTFLEFDQGHKAVRDFRQYGGIFKSRARSESPKRERSRAEDAEDTEKEREDSLVETETASGDSSPSEVSSGNDLMSQESFTTIEGAEQELCPQQGTDQELCSQPTSSWEQKRTPLRTALRTPLKSQSSPFVPMFHWSCMMGPFLEGCETDETQYYGAGDGSSEFEQQVAMQNADASGCMNGAGYELDNSTMGWPSGYNVQSWYASDGSTSSPYSSPRKKNQKLTSAEHDPPQQEYTTVMFRNLPNDYSQKMLLKLLEAEGFAGLYDFVYLPFDFKRQAGLGYAFINMISPEAAKKVKKELQGFKKWSLPSRKILEVCYSKPLQGLAANIERYRNSPVMHSDVPEEFKPALFKNKKRIPFPAPTVSLRPPLPA